MIYRLFLQANHYVYRQPGSSNVAMHIKGDLIYLMSHSGYTPSFEVWERMDGRTKTMKEIEELFELIRFAFNN